MNMFILFLVAGLILLIAEIFVPGGILGFIGTILLMLSSIICFNVFGTRIGLYYVVALIAGGAFGIIILFKFAHYLPFRKRLFLDTSEKGMNVEIEELKHLAGKSGFACSVLRPAGRVVIDGKRYDAVTEGTYIKQGEPVEVYRIDGNNLIVRQKTS
ncbi:MAG: NfeD family protein [Candidatus Auribacterota bacterium]|jgi:membrane-bound serine protease (ClpP class)|nr:NfeD family protein [Candidatus Auribacterota bacterium]